MSKPVPVPTAKDLELNAQDEYGRILASGYTRDADVALVWIRRAVAAEAERDALVGLDSAGVDKLLERWDQTAPSIQRGIVAKFMTMLHENAEEAKGWRKAIEETANAGAAACEAAAKLQAFKQFVHDYLDAKGIPTHPDGPHSKEGCRIGDRLDLVFAKIDGMRHALSVAQKWLANSVPLTEMGETPPLPIIAAALAK